MFSFVYQWAISIFKNINLFILIGGWLLYNIVLVLPYINMNLPQVYKCSLSWPPSLLPPHTIPLGLLSAPAPSIQYHALKLEWILSFKPTFSLSTCTFIKRLFSSSSLSAIRVVSSAYLRLFIFLLAILIPGCALSLRYN